MANERVTRDIIINYTESNAEVVKDTIKTIDRMIQNRQLNRYWKDQNALINDVTSSYEKYNKTLNKMDATELVKSFNALKALSGIKELDISQLLPNFDKVEGKVKELIKSIDLNEAFGVDAFSSAFKVFDMLKAGGIDLQDFFKRFDLDIDTQNLQKSLRLAEKEIQRVKNELVEKDMKIDSLVSGSGFEKQEAELESLRNKLKEVYESAEMTFNSFLYANNIDPYSQDGLYKYFQKIKDGAWTAEQAISEFKAKETHLLQESYNKSGGLFNLQQVQEFEGKLESVLNRVEEISRQMNDIIENGVMTKAMQNLSVDDTISQSQRDLFANVLKDKEALSSIAGVLKKIIDESVTLQGVNNKTFDEEQFNRLLILFEKIESSLSSMKAVFVDVGDGEEFSPLLKMINNVQESIEKLSTSVKGIGLNMNIDVGSDKELETQFQDKISKALIAYQRLFDHIKMSGVGGSVINDAFFNFDLNQFDTTIGKVKGLQQFIAKAREDAKALYGGQDVLKQDTDVKFWNQASAALAQMSIVEKQIKDSADTSSLESLFGGKTDLTEVTTQLGLIVTKLEEISANALEFKNIFKEGFNVTASIEEIEKLTSRVKELEDELSKVKVSSTSPVETNISSGKLDTVTTTTSVDKVTNSLIEEQKAIGELDMAFRGVEGSLNGFMSTSGRLATFFTDSPYLARQYADSLGGVYQASLALGNSLEINGKGRDWNAIEYLGDGSDEASKKIIELRNQINALYDQLQSLNVDGTGLNGRVEVNREDYSYLIQCFGDMKQEYDSYIEAVEKGNVIENQSNESAKSLMIQLYELEKAYKAISDAKTNVYGTHTTDEFAELAKLNGYDSVMFRNIKDSFDKLSRLTSVGVIFDESQVANATIVNDKIDELVRKLDRISASGLNLPLNIELPKEISKLQDGSFVNNLTGEIFDDLQEALKSLKELSSIADPIKDTFQGDKIEQATTSAKELDKILEQAVDVPTDKFDEILSKLDLTESKLGKIARITKQMHIDENGKPVESYTLKDKHGSTEIYGESSNKATKQLLSANYVEYDSKQAEKEAKELLAVEKEITKEIEKQEKAQASAQKKKWQAFESEQKKYVSDQKKTTDIEKNKSAYQELLDTIKQYSEVSKRIAKNETLDGDLELAQKLENKISELQKNPILSSSQIAKSERDLVNLFNQLDTLEKKTTKKQSDKSNAQSAKEQAEAWEKNVKAIQEYMDANTKLNNLKAQDAGTGKKAKEIEYQTKEVKRLEKVALEARATLSSMINPHDVPISDWNKWLDVMKQFDQATEGSAESLAKLEDSLRNMAKSQFKKVNDTLSNSEKYLELLKPTEGNRSVSFEKVVQEYDRAVNSLKEFHATLDATTPLTKEQSDKFEKLANDVKKARIEIDKIPKSQRGSDEDSRMKEIDKLTKYLDANTRISKEAKQQLQGYLALLKSGDPSVSVKELHTAWTKVAVAEREAGREGKRFFDIISDKALYGQAAQLAGYYLSLTDFIRYGKQAVDTIIELDTALIDLKKTTAMSGSEMENFYFEANDVAKEMGVTTQAIIEQSSAWSRLGYNTKEASTEMAKLSSKFATISPGMDTDTAQEGLVSIMKAWDIDVDQVESEVIDKINTLGNNFAEENQDIVEGMKRSAAALASTGTTYQDAFALFTGAQEVLQNSEVTGRALRSISMRIHGYSENSEDGLAELDEELTNITGDLIDLTKTAEHTQGVSIFKDGSTTEFKSLVDYFGEINAIWDEMSQKQQNDFLQMAFGKTQAQAGAALIQNYESVVGALEKMEQSAGSADAEMAAVESSLNYKINSLKETWVGTVQEMIDRGDLGVIIDGLVKLSEAIGFVLDKAGLLGTAGIIGGGILGVKNAGICV